MTSSNRPVPHYLKDLNSDIKGIKIAVLKTVSDEIRNEDIKNNFAHVVNTFKQLGAIVEEVEIPNHLARAILPTYTIIANNIFLYWLSTLCLDDHNPKLIVPIKEHIISILNGVLIPVI